LQIHFNIRLIICIFIYNKKQNNYEKENIKSLVGNHVAPYIYNSKNFEPGKTPIYYSGPYWDNKEVEAAIDTLLNGKWITSGEKVFLFEKYFSQKERTRFFLMKAKRECKDMSSLLSVGPRGKAMHISDELSVKYPNLNCIQLLPQYDFHNYCFCKQIPLVTRER